ncbi:BREX-1 system adenine-specific DNA-methyltransferase PglX [Aeromonas media]
MAKHFYRASTDDFKNIPGSPIVYWGSKRQYFLFKTKKVDTIAIIPVGIFTCDNGRFVRLWHEVAYPEVNLTCQSCNVAINNNAKWVGFNKGGESRRWYGNKDYIIRFERGGEDIMALRQARGQSYSLPGYDYYFKAGVTWAQTSSKSFSCRMHEVGSVHDTAGPTLFSDVNDLFLAFLNSKPAISMLGMINPTLHFQAGDVRKLPIIFDNLPISDVRSRLSNIVNISSHDWNSSESAVGFFVLPLLVSEEIKETIDSSYVSTRECWRERTLEMQRLEEENNRLFIEAYGLQDELTPEVPLSEITLTCNPHYRYGGNLTDEEREARLQSDTIAELVSYAIGCMMGRYSLDREGLVYAHAGNVGFNDLVAEGAYKTFAADGDGILPLTSEHWFEDDIAARIEEFVRTVWGADTLEENLQFIADSLCLSAIKPPKKGGETSRETIRRYLSTQFFKDHLKTYKKRPIYWLFSSGKEKAFECLVYLHRYNEATLPRMRTEYVTPLLGQMASRIERKRMEQTEASTSDAKRIGKEIDCLTKQLSELRAFDDQLKHHADMRITLDLDDGVKVNYGKFGTLLSDVKAITGDKGE